MNAVGRVSFPAHTSVERIRDNLSARGLTEKQIDDALESVRIEGGMLKDPLSVNLKPAATNPAAGLARPAPAVDQRSTAVAANKDSALREFMKDTIAEGLAYDLKQSFDVTDHAEVTIENEVVQEPSDPAQKAFLAQNPQGTILRARIRIETTTDDLLELDNIKGKLGGNYDITLEIPCEKFSGTNVKDQVNKLKERVLTMWDLARLPSDDFWDEVARKEIPAGTRIMREFELEGGARLGGEDAAIEGGRRTAVAFETRWETPNRVSLAVDTLRKDDAALGLTLGDITGRGGVEETNHYVHAYHNIDPAEHTEALRTALKWDNGMLPERIDTERLDALGCGTFTFDVGSQKTAGGRVFVPIGSVQPSVEGSKQKTERFTVTLPDHRPDGTLIPRAEAQSWVAALASTDTGMLLVGIPNAKLTQVHEEKTVRDFQTKLKETADLVPDYVNVGALVRFGRTLTERDILTTTIRYSDTEPRTASVTMSKIDLHRQVKQFALEVGLVLDSELENEISDALRDHVLAGVGLERFAEDLGDATFGELQKLAEKVRVTFENERTSLQTDSQTLHFANFDLSDRTDKEALAKLLQRDPALAIKNGHLTEVTAKSDNQTKEQTEIELVGWTLLELNSRDWSFDVRQNVKVEDDWVQLELTEGGKQRSKDGLIEDFDFEASTYTVLRNGEMVDALTRVSFGGNDKMFMGREAKTIQGTVSATDMQVVTKEIGDGSWWLGWLAGPNYGEADIDMAAVILPKGHQKLLELEPDTAARSAMFLASQMLAVRLPPSEKEIAGADLFVGLSRPQSDPKLNEALAAARFDVRVHEMEKARELVRAKDARLAAIPDVVLDDLLESAAASSYLAEVRDLLGSQSRTMMDKETKERLEGFEQYYETLTGGRSAETDLWIIEQGLLMRSLFERPELAEARQLLSSGQSLAPKDAASLVAHLLEDAREKATPAVFGTNRQGAGVLATWTSLLSLVGPENSMGYLSIQADDFKLIAHSAKLHPNDVKRLIKRGGQQALDAARLEAGGPKRMQRP